jgi:hypothetical protein
MSFDWNPSTQNKIQSVPIPTLVYNIEPIRLSEIFHIPPANAQGQTAALLRKVF